MSDDTRRSGGFGGPPDTGPAHGVIAHREGRAHARAGYRIAAPPGCGIGREVLPEDPRVLEAAADDVNLSIDEFSGKDRRDADQPEP